MSLEPKQSADSPASGQTSIERMVRGKCNISEERQNKLTECVVNYVAQDLLPLSTVDSSAFKKLMHTAEPNYTLPSRKHLSGKLIPEKADEVKAQLMLELSQASSICLTIDLWSSRDCNRWFMNRMFRQTSGLKESLFSLYIINAVKKK